MFVFTKNLIYALEKKRQRARRIFYYGPVFFLLQVEGFILSYVKNKTLLAAAIVFAANAVKKQ